MKNIGWGFKPVFRCSKPHTFSTFSGVGACLKINFKMTVQFSQCRATNVTFYNTNSLIKCAELVTLAQDITYYIINYKTKLVIMLGTWD